MKPILIAIVCLLLTTESFCQYNRTTIHKMLQGDWQEFVIKNDSIYYPNGDSYILLIDSTTDKRQCRHHNQCYVLARLQDQNNTPEAQDLWGRHWVMGTIDSISNTALSLYWNGGDNIIGGTYQKITGEDTAYKSPGILGTSYQKKLSPELLKAIQGNWIELHSSNKVTISNDTVTYIHQHSPILPADTDMCTFKLEYHYLALTPDLDAQGDSEEKICDRNPWYDEATAYYIIGCPCFIEPIFSVSKNFMRLGKNGDIVYKRDEKQKGPYAPEKHVPAPKVFNRAETVKMCKALLGTWVKTTDTLESLVLTNSLNGTLHTIYHRHYSLFGHPRVISGYYTVTPREYKYIDPYDTTGTDFVFEEKPDVNVLEDKARILSVTKNTLTLWDFDGETEIYKRKQ